MREAGGRLRLRCLGSLRLEDSAGKDITPRTRRARAVLAYLALSGRPASRERLADLLWSDRAGEQARASVRQALFELRHLGEGAGLIDSPGRDETAIDADRLTTDLSLIRIAAQAGDWDRLQELLSASDQGLLTDLDGLDPEYDAWLQVERADEPARTLSAALAAAERCLAEAGPRAAQGIVAEVQRLDPSCEEAVRLAMRIDHELGDRGALHRHFDLFRERLKEDYAAEPSDETLELFRRLTSPSAAPGRRHAAIGDGDVELAPAPRALAGISNRSRLALLALALLALLGFALWQLRSPAGTAEPLPLIAVLPFEQQPAGDTILADGLWEDTRLALSQTGTMRVLGRATTLEMAKAGRAPAKYRRMLGVDYLLEGIVRRQGDRVRVSLSLTRTSDGVGIWHSALTGRLGDAMALQAAVAQGIEGRLRGRLALGGGRLPEQIATTPEVYALYSEARSALRARSLSSTRQAISLLNRALQLDPNFAPAWSMRGSAAHFAHFAADASDDWRVKARADVRRALELAPKLAEAHATLALIGGLGSPSAERSLKRAVALDPGNSEAWNWLGIARTQRDDFDGSVQAFQRAVDIDPLLAPAIENLSNALLERRDRAGFRRLLDRLAQLDGGGTLVTALQAHRRFREGDYSRGLAPLLALHSRPGDLEPLATWKIGEGLLRLGYVEQAGTIFGQGDEFATELRGQWLRPELTQGMISTPREFWVDVGNATVSSRTMIKRGQGKALVDSYRRGFSSREDFLITVAERGAPAISVPVLAVALRDAGQAAEAEALLTAIEGRAELRLQRLPGGNDAAWELARIRAAQGRTDDALRLVSRALDRGWLPDGWLYPLDIADDPPFRRLRDDPRFKRARGRILAHIARERAELGPLKI